MIELVILIGVVIWFARMGTLKRGSGLLWGFIGAISYCGPIFVFGSLVAPAIFGTAAMDSLVLYFGLILLGMSCCLIARRILMNMQPKSIESIISALKNKNPRVRRVAAEALCHSNDTRAVEPLIFALQDQDYEVRANAAKALYFMKDAKAVEPLIAALGMELDVSKAASDAFTREKGCEPLICPRG